MHAAYLLRDVAERIERFTPTRAVTLDDLLEVLQILQDLNNAVGQICAEVDRLNTGERKL